MEKEAEMLEQKIPCMRKRYRTIQNVMSHYAEGCRRKISIRQSLRSAGSGGHPRMNRRHLTVSKSTGISDRRHSGGQCTRQTMPEHAVYLAGRTEYLVSRMQKMADEMRRE